MSSLEFGYEEPYWEEGLTVAGADEVGRGAFAGPVVAGACVFASNTDFDQDVVIDDSKKLSPEQRETANAWIRENARWGLGEASVSEINKLGMGKASEMAFRRAVANLKVKLDALLIDAFYVPYVKGVPRVNQKPIKQGDSKSFSIAAASIIAKVYRDRLMQGLGSDSRYERYNWVQNKGYGSLEHRNAIVEHGSTRHHRKRYVETFLKKFI